MENTQVYDHLTQIFLTAVKRVDPYRMIHQHVTLKGNTLNIVTERESHGIDLDNFDKIIIIGAGKATAKMAKAIEEILGKRIHKGIISVKYGHTENLEYIKTIESGHPVPDENCLRAAREIEDLANLTDERTLFILLISGGGSALLTSPVSFSTESKDIELSIDDIQKTTTLLLSCGATIGEINCIRKHLSRIKGGRLTRLLYPGRVISFILSDVVGDRLDTIASGLTTFDNTTYEEALSIIRTYKIDEKIPEKVLHIIEAGAEGLIEETPKEEDPVFEKITNILIGTNYTALHAAAKEAHRLGYNTVVLSSQITGEAREVAKIFFAVAKDIKEHDLLAAKPACVIAGGETTVTLWGDGKGGRNQEIALSFLSQLQKNCASTEGIYFLSASTDGNDGPTDAAGAFASYSIVQKSRKLELDIAEYLQNNDSYTFFNKLGYLLKTGPTNTNVCDVHIIIVK